MAASTSQVVRVKPDNGAREGRYLAIVIVAILGFTALALPHHQANSGIDQLSANQIAVEQLPKQQLRPLRELNIANEELQFYQQDEQRWPDVTELADEFIAPFNDQQWHWQQVESGVYLGTNQNHSLLLNAEQSTLWYLNASHSRYQAPLDHYLAQGWQQVMFNQLNTHSTAHGDKH